METWHWMIFKAKKMMCFSYTKVSNADTIYFLQNFIRICIKKQKEREKDSSKRLTHLSHATHSVTLWYILMVKVCLEVTRMWACLTSRSLCWEGPFDIKKISLSWVLAAEEDQNGIGTLLPFFDWKYLSVLTKSTTVQNVPLLHECFALLRCHFVKSVYFRVCS